MRLASASASDLTAIMTDYYKTLNLEKNRQLQQQHQLKEEFLCEEDLGPFKQMKMARRASGIGRPGFSSSSEYLDEEDMEGIEEEKSSDDEEDYA